MAANGRGRIERRIEGLADLIELEERFAEQAQLGWNPKPLRAGMTDQTQDYLADVDLLERRILHFDHQAGDLPAEFHLLEPVPLLADLDDDLGVRFGLAFADRQKKLEETLLHLGGDPPDHSEIEQGDPPVIGQIDIAGM